MIPGSPTNFLVNINPQRPTAKKTGANKGKIWKEKDSKRERDLQVMTGVQKRVEVVGRDRCQNTSGYFRLGQVSKNGWMFLVLTGGKIQVETFGLDTSSRKEREEWILSFLGQVILVATRVTF